MKQRGKTHRRAVLAWGLFWAGAAQVVVIGYLEWRQPDFLDPKYGWRMRVLRAIQHEHAPCLVLGSSRAEQGFRPSLLPEATNARPMTFYNLARGGSSPLLYLLTLHRLLADGVQPAGLLIEIFPPALTEEEAVIYKPTLRDLPLLRRYAVYGRTWTLWSQDRLLLWTKYRNAILASVAPAAMPTNSRWGDRLWNAASGEWRAIGTGVSDAERRRLTEDARRRYGDSLRNFHVADNADRALRELLATCREQRIVVALFVMPEAAEFRSWYTPQARQRLSEYLDSLSAEYKTPCIDARRWIADAEFADGHHLLAGGAAAFTYRFADAAEIALDPGTRSLASRRTP